MWSVTMIGAPKKAAAQAIEDLEKSPRAWYGGAIGKISLNGDMNTGILIRTIHLKNAVAEYSVGATLLYDSDPESEEVETRLKATGFRRAIRPAPAEAPATVRVKGTPGAGVKLLLVDNEDCFIHTLSNYVRQTGADVATFRHGFPPELLDQEKPDIILVSPGPGRPSDFKVPGLVRLAADRKIPVFGVCLGLQGTVEAFGGELGVLCYPSHGKPATVDHDGKGVFTGLPKPFKIGRYHSLYAIEDKLPECLEITAKAFDDNEKREIIMGVRHKELRIEAVQFHPESILTLEDDCGLKLMENVVRILGKSGR
jgi:anthranilate synthase